MPSRRPRVAIVRHTHLYHRSVSRTAEALLEQGYDCDFFYLGEPGTTRIQWMNGVRLIRVPGAKSRGGGLRYIAEYGSFFVLTAVMLAWHHLRRRYRLVQIYTMPDFLVLAAIVPKLFGARVLAFMQEPAPELAEAIGQGKRTVKMLKRLEQLTLRFADGAIAVTEDLRRRFIERGADGRRIAVVLNCSTSEAVTTAHGRTQPDDGAVVLICHGTVEPRWGHNDILQALAIARARAPQLRLVLTGMGTGVDAVLALSDRLDLDDIVSWEGWVTEERLGELLKSAHIGIVAQKPSDYSNLVQTTKMYDYWAVGLPVIASRLHATAAVFNDSEIAYYRPDDASDLAEQLVRLGNDPHLREAYAAAGRSAYQRFGWHVQREIYLDAVQHVLTDRQLAADDLEQAGVPQ